jgi:hypothetical protein
MILAACHSGPPQVSIDGAKAELSSAIVGEVILTMNIRNKGGSGVLEGVKVDVPERESCSILFKVNT